MACRAAENRDRESMFKSQKRKGGGEGGEDQTVGARAALAG